MAGKVEGYATVTRRQAGQLTAPVRKATREPMNKDDRNGATAALYDIDLQIVHVTFPSGVYSLYARAQK